MSNPAQSGYIPALDGIRGVAVFWVVLHNATDMPVAPPGPLSHVLLILTHPGWIGVQLFFALSGFLITGGLLDSIGERTYFRDFYAKRALRILPLYYAVLFVMLVIFPSLFGGVLPYSTTGQRALWLFTANTAHPIPYGFAHFWSLSIEEQFYLFWPLVVFRASPLILLRVCLVLSVGALSLRVALVAAGVAPWTLYTSTLCRMDALALGAAGACLLRIPRYRQAVAQRSDLLAALSLFVFLVGGLATHLYDRDSWPCETWGYTLLALCSASFVLAGASSKGGSRALVERVLRLLPVRSVGKYSYAIYVFHGLIHKLVGEPMLTKRFGAAPGGPVVILYALLVFVVSYGMARVSYVALERPFLKLKDCFTRVPLPA
jgi:peptidoglycan/LPS O-acetylase OafA/YrhL